MSLSLNQAVDSEHLDEVDKRFLRPHLERLLIAETILRKRAEDAVIPIPRHAPARFQRTYANSTLRKRNRSLYEQENL